MSFSYTYVLGVDFTATNIDLAAFQNTVGTTTGLTSLQYIIRSGTSVTLYFSIAIVGTSLTTLNGLVASYVYVASSSLIYVDETTTQQLGNKQFYTTDTIIDTTDSTKVMGFTLSGMSTATQLTLAGTLTSNRTYTFPEAGANSNILLTNSSGTQTIATGSLGISNSAASTSSTTGALQVAGGAYFGANSLMNANLTLQGASAVLALSNTTISTSSSTGAIQNAGGLFTKNIFIGGIGITSAGTLTGPLLNVAATTITASNTSDMAFVSIQQPTLANSVVASTTTNASTLYIANAPAAGTNETITNAYAVNVAAGKVYLGGALQIPTGATNGFYLKSDASGNATWAALSFSGSGNFTGPGSTTATAGTINVSPASTAFTASNNYYFSYFAQPTTTGTTTGTASTIYIANAPANATTAYALNVAAGNCNIGSTTASTSIATGALVVAGGIGCNNMYVSDITMTSNFPCILSIDCNGSQITPGQILFANSDGTGDFSIMGSGGDITWQGGGGRGLQMAAWHEIYLMGGRTTGTAPAYINGSNATYNTIVLNNNDSIGLTIRGVSGQTADLQQWQNSASTVLSKIQADGSLVISATTASTSSITGAIQCAGGAYFGATSMFNANVDFIGVGSTTTTSGTLNVAPSSTAFSGANTYYFSYFARPLTTGSTTGSAYTIYVENPPLNATKSYALYVAAGNNVINGQVQSNQQILSTLQFTPATTFVATGQGTNTLAYSTTGTSWTGLGTTIFTTRGNGCAWSGSLYVAVGQGTNTIASSSNGTTWSGQGLTIFSTAGIGIMYNGTMWVAVGSGTNTIAYSTTGTSWTGLGTTIFSTSGRGIDWNGYMWVAVGSGTNSIAYSYDGINWCGLGTTIFSTQGNCIMNNGSQWVAVGSGTNTIASSTNGITWIGQGTTIFTTSGNYLDWNGSLWVAVGAGTNTIATSASGTSWTGQGTTIFSTAGNGIAWNGTNWLAAGQGTNSLAYSATGTSWTGLGTTIFTTAGTNIIAAIDFWNSALTVSSGSVVFTGNGGSTPAGCGFCIVPSATILGPTTYFTYFGQPTTSGTGTTASTITIAGAPTGGTITNAYALNVASGNCLFGGNLTLNGTAAALALTDTTSVITLANTTASTSSSTGALQCAGGAYFGAGCLYNANLTINSSGSLILSNTTASTSSSTGALQCAGGAYFGAGSIFNAGVQIPTGAGLNYILQSDASGNATWTSTVNQNFTATSTAVFNTTATTPTNITAMTLTPTTAGTYLVLFTTQCTCTTNTITLTLRLAFKGTAIAATSTTVTTRVANETFSVNLSSIQTFNGTTNTITAQLGSSSGTTTVSANTRYITAIRLSA